MKSDRPEQTGSLILALCALLVLLGPGCATLPDLDAAPEGQLRDARIAGVPATARAWGDEAPHYARNWFETSQEALRQQYAGIMDREHHYLGLSGGGPNGAFAAGLLGGWTAHGDRPEFTLVTGISTGALLAPMAFLGPRYDDQIREMYTAHSTRDIAKKRNLLRIIAGDAVASTEPLQALIAKYITPQLLTEIAAEHRKGRQLLIGTTHLDAGRPVTWNIGRIAASGSTNALQLVRKVLLASASIPVAFPPVFFEVDVNGTRHYEMHVDGGATSQVFAYPASVGWSAVTAKLGVVGRANLYVIRNSQLAPQWKATRPKLLPMAGRTIDSLIRTQGIGDLYRLYLAAERDGINFHLAYIPDEFDVPSEEQFDPVYMKALYELGYRLASKGYPWHKGPYGFEQEAEPAPSASGRGHPEG